MPARIAALPIDPERGYPIPFFVAYVNGKPEFRVADARKWMRCVKEQLCWVCGQKLGRNKAFVIGPMCSVNRISADAPTHLDCAEFSVKVCPFLTKPQMVRREDEFIKISREQQNDDGMIERNPGVMAVWVTREYKIIRGAGKNYIFALGKPESISWWSQGRIATRDEILESMRTGLPLLEQACEKETTPELVEEAKAQVHEQHKQALQLLPA